MEKLKTYWLARPGESAHGPYAYEQISHMWTSGGITADTLICPVDGPPKWSPLAAAMKAALAAKEVESQSGPRVTYLILGLIFGMFGVHNFWADEQFKGIIKIVLTSLGLALSFYGITGYLILAFNAVWCIAESISGPSRYKTE